jgi:hypothetical protein
MDNSRLFTTLGIEVQDVELKGKGKLPLGPSWAVAIATLPFPNKRWKRRALERALTDLDWRNAAVATLALGGSPEAVMNEAMESMIRAYRRR